MTDEDVRREALSLLAGRAPDTTVCPSEIARALAGASGSGKASEEWRDAMPAVHAAVDRLLGEGLVRLSWRGRRLTVRDGPYRIGHPDLE